MRGHHSSFSYQTNNIKSFDFLKYTYFRLQKKFIITANNWVPGPANWTSNDFDPDNLRTVVNNYVYGYASASDSVCPQHRTSHQNSPKSLSKWNLQLLLQEVVSYCQAFRNEQEPPRRVPSAVYLTIWCGNAPFKF